MIKKLIVLEGSDGVGKETQSKLLEEFLKNDGHNVKRISFPNYKSPSSTLATAYLDGEYGDKAEDINVYASSLFFTVDRIATFRKELADFDGIAILDRYTTANMIHQAAKLNSIDEMNQYIDWLSNLEFELCGLPRPDQVFFLDVPYSVSKKLIEERNNKSTNDKQKDIHERDERYMIKSYETAKYVANRLEWTVIDCIEDQELLPREKIHKKIKENLLI